MTFLLFLSLCPRPPKDYYQKLDDHAWCSFVASYRSRAEP